MLFGASDSYSADKKMQVTVALNHFGKGLVERMPRCRFGDSKRQHSGRIGNGYHRVTTSRTVPSLHHLVIQVPASNLVPTK
ncbi:hypothetical protein Gotri_011228 [Gossypium trilobum]|uniref:Uncharacterized protein n=1 Tax=Gossypium trilobum TaxID=34281 RepID=A0A7J9ET47_9ROSI|nr:hypothetical protein [Gossypium trilobum]